MKKFTLALLLIFAGLNSAGAAAAGHLKAWDPQYFSIDAGDWIQIVRFDRKQNVYEIKTIEDPTVLKIYATKESLAKSLPFLNADVLKTHPLAIVGHQYQLQSNLVIESEDN